MATYYVDLPSDYLHLLNCIVVYNVKRTYKCYNKGDTWRCAATRLTSDAYSQVLDNFWLKPSYKRPYYYIHNINKSVEVPTNPVEYDATEEITLPQHVDEIEKDTNNHITGGYEIIYERIDGTKYIKKTIYYGKFIDNIEENPDGNPTILNVDVSVVSSGNYKEGTDSSSNQTNQDRGFGEDGNGNIIINGVGLPKTVNIHGGNYSNVERGQAIRYGNVSKVRMEIRYGTDTGIFSLDNDPNNPNEKGGYIYIDYIKAPQYIRLTQEEVDYTEDRSQMLEFPDYVCQEILNELVILIMENISDPKIQTFPVVSQSIANPAQAQAPAAAGQSAQ